MTDEIRVGVKKYPDRKNLVMIYTDPMTGKSKTKTAGTANRHEDVRRAAKWEHDLREGRYKPASEVMWSEFRERYEGEVLSGLAEGTQRRVHGIFNIFEKIAAPHRLRDVNGSTLSRYAGRLRESHRSESSIGAHLAHLQSALRWAVKVSMLTEMPDIQKPKRTNTMKGRPISGEEFDRMIAVVPKVVGDDAAPSWQHYLHGFWLSGLRLGESLALSWGDQAAILIDLNGEFPMLLIPPELDKGHEERHLPITPDFAEFLLRTPEEARTGYVFNPRTRKGTRPGQGTGSARRSPGSAKRLG